MASAVPTPRPGTPPKRSFREQMHIAREDAIVSAVNRLLAEKGFDAMTVDEVAVEVGIAKASLYKHFPSKEDLAAAAMARVMERARAFLEGLDASRAAQADGSLNPALPPIAVLYTLYARACDPVLGFLKGSGLYSHEQIIEMVLSTCFDGLRTR